MSGTSLDGLDLCYVAFTIDQSWSFEILGTKCVSYTEHWRETLKNAHTLDRKKLNALSLEFGRFTAEKVLAFLAETDLPSPDIICSHGHTVFHQPEKKITLQIGDGHEIADTTGIKTVSDFRSLDVSLGGQGAPLVPIGDELLFSEHAACLNLGGFSNISFKLDGGRKAFDVCPVNIVLNPLALKLGFEFDKSGELAKSGNLDIELLKKLNALSIYESKNRPSLAREWLEEVFTPLIDEAKVSTEDKLRTLTEHAAVQISKVINYNVKNGSVLVTGGGAKNDFLMERISELSAAEIVVPENEIVEFKEALIFAFLGVLKIRNEINVLNSVTGASRDSCSGVVNIPR
mgnify:CR=1 FL=1